MPPCSLVDWYQNMLRPSSGRTTYNFYTFISIPFFVPSFSFINRLILSLLLFLRLILILLLFFSSFIMSYFILLLSFRPFTLSYSASHFLVRFHLNPSFFQFLFLLHVLCRTNLFHHHAKKLQKRIPHRLLCLVSYPSPSCQFTA
jgi:hypothetical protein